MIYLDVLQTKGGGLQPETARGDVVGVSARSDQGTQGRGGAARLLGPVMETEQEPLLPPAVPPLAPAGLLTSWPTASQSGTGGQGRGYGQELRSPEVHGVDQGRQAGGAAHPSGAPGVPTTPNQTPKQGDGPHDQLQR